MQNFRFLWWFLPNHLFLDPWVLQVRSTSTNLNQKLKKRSFLKRLRTILQIPNMLSSTPTGNISKNFCKRTCICGENAFSGFRSFCGVWPLLVPYSARFINPRIFNLKPSINLLRIVREPYFIQNAIFLEKLWEKV